MVLAGWVTAVVELEVAGLEKALEVSERGGSEEPDYSHG